MSGKNETLTPEFSDWQHLMKLVKDAADKDQHEMLLTMMMTADERDALARILLNDDLHTPMSAFAQFTSTLHPSADIKWKWRRVRF